MIDPKSGPRGLDVEHPNAARIYDALLGGDHNYAMDRMFAKEVVSKLPIVRTIAWANREFLGRAVRFLVSQGVTQFLDIGSGVPTVGNVHEVADRVNGDSRCVYVDFEPVAAAHCRLVLEDHGDPGRHAVVEQDMRNVDDVWEQALASGVLDPHRPIGLIMVAMLHFVLPEHGAHAAVARYRDLLPAGSYLVVSHGTRSGVPVDVLPSLDQTVRQYGSSSTPCCFRTREEIAGFFGDFDLVEPGLVWLPQWRLDGRDSPASSKLTDNPGQVGLLGAVGRKPGA